MDGFIERMKAPRKEVAQGWHPEVPLFSFNTHLRNRVQLNADFKAAAQLGGWGWRRTRSCSASEEALAIQGKGHTGMQARGQGSR